MGQEKCSKKTHVAHISEGFLSCHDPLPVDFMVFQ